MTKQKRKYNRELSERFKLASRALPGIVYDVDLRTGEEIRTQGLQALLGFDPREVDSSNEWWNERIHPQERAGVLEHFRSCVESPDVDYCHAEYRIRHRGGHYIHVSDQALILRDENGKAARVVGSNIDITKYKEAEEELRSAWKREQQAREETEAFAKEVERLRLAEKLSLQRERELRERAEAANRAKDEFLANLSHELRSPLQSILGWIRLVRRSSLDAETAQKAAETIERNTESQIQLVTDLLEVSRIITGKARVQFRPLDLKDLVQTAIDSIRPVAEAKQIRLVYEEFSLSAPIVGDADRIQQVMWNILSNAVKFTPVGGQIRTEVVRSGECFDVITTDSGIGIDANFLPYVFDRLTQSDSSSTRSHKGLGLGLAIVRHLMELHGGSVTAESDGKGKGSTFVLSFPAQEIPIIPTAQRVHDFVYDQHSLDGKKFLVVDDDNDALELLQILLSSAGAEVRVAISVEAGLAALEGFSANAIISDIAMPERDGFEFARILKQAENSEFRSVPLIALTAFASEQDRDRILKAGFDLHLSKPVEPEDLIRRLEEAVVSY